MQCLFTCKAVLQIFKSGDHLNVLPVHRNPFRAKHVGTKCPVSPEENTNLSHVMIMLAIVFAIHTGFSRDISFT